MPTTVGYLYASRGHLATATASEQAVLVRLGVRGMDVRVDGYGE